MIDIPDVVRQSASASSGGRAWLEELPELVEQIAAEWDLIVGAAMSGGTASYVAEVTRADGSPAVLKLAMPADIEGRGALINEVEMLRLAGGRGCVELYAFDLGRRAFLSERLGPTMSTSGLSPGDQLDALADALSQVWIPVTEPTPLGSLADKGPWLAEFIATRWADLDHPCSGRTVDIALTHVESRMAVYDTGNEVLLHGDGHNNNALATLDGRRGWKLIDPDGLVGEPAYDLAIPLREYTDELLASGDPLKHGEEHCRRLADRTGVDARAIWQWGFVERLSTGLFCLVLGHDRWATSILAVADAWALGDQLK